MIDIDKYFNKLIRKELFNYLSQIQDELKMNKMKKKRKFKVFKFKFKVAKVSVNSIPCGEVKFLKSANN